MSDTDDKPSLKDIAQKDGAEHDGANAAAQDPSETSPEASTEATEPAPKSGGGFMWVVVVLVVVGGAVAAGWPYIGPRVEPVIADVRALMGLTPRPTQASMPPESMSQTVPPQMPEVQPESVPEAMPEAQSEAMAEAMSEAAPVQETVPETAPGGAAEVAPEIATAVTPEVRSEVTPSVDGLTARLGVLESQVAALGTMSGADGQLALQATADLAQALSQLKNDLSDVSARLQSLEDSSRADPTAPAQAMVLGMTQLRSRLLGDGPFAAELAALESIAGEDAEVNAAVGRLRPHADVGIPTEAALTARFDKVAKQIISARSTSEAGGWLAVVKDSLGGLVTVRRTDPAEITDAVERAVAIAEAALELGELAEAVNALSELQGAPGDAAAPWLGDARARVEAEAALEALHRHALAVLSAAGGA